MKKLLFTLVLAAVATTVSAQDLIVKKDAQEIEAKVLRSGGSRIEYTLKGQSTGPTYTLPTSEVLFIKYSDGRKEEFKTPPRAPRRIIAQYKVEYPHYQGEVSVGYGLGVGEFSEGRMVVETVHGARLSPYLFIGPGVGLNYFFGDKTAGMFENETAGVISAFGNAKGYYPVSPITSVYLSLDLGAAIGVWGYATSARNFYTAVGPGVRIGSTKNRMSFNAGVRYQYMGKGTDAVLFQIGLGF